VYDSIALFRVCQEAVLAGIQNIIIVNSPSKPSLTDAVERYFVESSENGSELTTPTVHEVIQSRPLGLGHAVHCAMDVIDQFPVAVLLPDVLLSESSDMLPRMIEMASTERSVVSVRTAHAPQLNRSGVVEFAGAMIEGVEIKNLVEKPAPGDEPSDQMVVGRYLLTREIFELLGRSTAGTTGEIELTDSISAAARSRSGAVLACSLTEGYQDTGTHDGLFLAGLHQFALAKLDSEYSAPVEQLIELLERDLGLGGS
jgi:UTP--glucose-1-phosphate uridylyltransferase